MSTSRSERRDPFAGVRTRASGCASDAVGLNATDTWATDNGSGNHGDITNVGSAYPICGVTFMLVYSGLHSTGSSAIDALSKNQRQTLYAYVTYVLSNTGQDRLRSIYYAPLPSTWLSELRIGFQGAF